MIDELRIYDLKPGALPAYLDAFERIALPIMPRYMALRGFWTVDCGNLNQFYHLARFDNHDQRMKARAALGADPGWPAFRKIALDLVLAQRNVILLPAFSDNLEQPE